MSYKTGRWGDQAKLRSRKRLEYFREYQRKRLKKLGIKVGIGLGWKGEQEAINILKGSNKYTRQIDLIWKDKLVDVKTAKPSCSKGIWYWKFLLYKQKGIVDFFLFICKDLEEKTKHILLIPDKDIKKNNFSIPLRKEKDYLKYLLKGSD